MYFKDEFLRFFSIKFNSKFLFFFYFLITFFTTELSRAENDNLKNTEISKIEIKYLDSRNELEDYILDTGDSIYLEFYPADELNGVFPINDEGEIFLPRINETYVRGLTTSELKNLLEMRYEEFLINPEIRVRVAVFKGIRVLVIGEVRNPGFYKFAPFKSDSFLSSEKPLDKPENVPQIRNYNSQYNTDKISQFSSNIDVKRDNENVATISDVIRKAGGITSRTDLSNIEIIRDVPIGKGGGKKRAFVNFNSYINSSDTTKDIRIYDGDSLFFPRLSEPDKKQVPKSIISGVSPKFIKVNIFGRIETPGIVKIPLEATLSDAIDLTGPIKPLSGKITLIRYEIDGKVSKRNISYSANAKRGSKRNPFLKEDDLITVRNSLYGKSAGVIKELTAPFVGIYATKQLYEDFSE